MESDSVLWKRLDTPGHDACRLEVSDVGWRLAGTAVFRHDGDAAKLDYHVEGDRAWRTGRGHVQGWFGRQDVEIGIERTAAGWTLDGADVPGLEGCVDLDLGFTPATNVLPLRRLALGVSEAADAPAAWLDVAAGALGELSQRYERRSDESYWYEAPSVGYAALLEVTSTGFVRRYPDLWEMET